MKSSLPPLFLERLRRIIPAADFSSVLASFSSPPIISVRVNTLKITTTDVIGVLKKKGVSCKPVSWCPEALILEGAPSEEMQSLELFADGRLYRQSLSSLLPVIVLDPQPGERVLDLCAAPGSKTTQMAARMRNQGTITAVEAIRPRYYKLKSVADHMGVQNVSFVLKDGRRFHSHQSFDKILVDAPCSSEGRFKTAMPKTYAYWSLRKIKEMVRKQRGLLLSASRLLKPGGRLVYATCTFAPEENEGVVNWLLKKTEGMMRVQPVVLEGLPSYAGIPQWEERAFNPEAANGFRVLPGPEMEGFFLAQMEKII